MISKIHHESQENEKVKKALDFILSIKGVLRVKLLNESEKRIVLELEGSAEKRVLMGLMPGINQGVREALSRSFTVAAITSNAFEWPKRGLIKIVIDGEVLGEDVRDHEELENLKREGHVVLANFIVIHKDKYEKFRRVGGFRGTTLVVAPLDLPWVKRIPHAQRAVVGSPSPPADIFIKKLLGLSEEGPLGSILIGFDLE